MSFNPNDPAASGMVLTFSDEFDTYDASPGFSSATKWSNTTWWDGGAGGSGFEKVDPDLSYVDDDKLVLECVKIGEQWWCGWLVSFIGGTGFTQKYGYFEASIKAPAGQGTWGAWWLFNREWLDTGTTGRQELDILETDGNPAFEDEAAAVLHNDWSQEEHQLRGVWTRMGTLLSADFHRYGVLWPPGDELIRVYIDGTQVGTIEKFPDTDDADMFLILGNQIGSMNGNFQEPTGPTFMYVDWVRAWQFGVPPVIRYLRSEASSILCGPGTRRELSLEPQPAPPPPESFAVDTYTDTNSTLLTAHTSDSGHDWIAPFGAAVDMEPVIQDNRAQTPAPTGNWHGIYLLDVVAPSSDYRVEVDVVRLTANFSNFPGIIGRASTTEQTWYNVRQDFNGNVVLMRRVSGSNAVLASAFASPPAVSEHRRIALEMVGTDIRGYYSDNDGQSWTLVGDVSDNNIAGPGRIGHRQVAELDQGDMDAYDNLTAYEVSD